MELFGINIIDVIVAGGIGALFYGFLDKAIKIALIKKFPEKLIIKYVEELDNKYIDPLKKKFPESIGELEKTIANTLRASADKIEDK